jgi:hypothetical protein
MNLQETAKLEFIRSKIEPMNKERHIQALNILAKYASVTINEQKYGKVNVNLSCVPPEAVEDLCKFISYVEAQEMSLMEIETQKKRYHDTYFQETSSARVGGGRAGETDTDRSMDAAGDTAANEYVQQSSTASSSA